MAYFDCQIVQGGGGVILTVTCHSVYAGTTITATDGETTLTATCPSSSPYTVEFKLPNTGSWTISGTYSGDTQTTTVVIPDSATLTPPIPTGSTVTPVNDIQTWLHCANVWDKTYTTISQVLSDTSLVTTLIASNNAVDYMARSTSWASSVTANSSAMTKIGANNYCANKLLANTTWLNAICNSTYFESVLNVKVPTMTSDTTPSGVASCYKLNSSGGSAYLVFDGNDSTYVDQFYGQPGTPSLQWLQYKFTQAKKINAVRYKLMPTFNDGAYLTSFKIQGSNTGNNNDFDDVTTVNGLSGFDNKICFLNDSDYQYWRLQVINTNNNRAVGVYTLQFYGR